MISIHLKKQKNLNNILFVLNLIANMLKATVSPWHGFWKIMAYVMMNHLLKSGPRNLEVTYEYSVCLVSFVVTY